MRAILIIIALLRLASPSLGFAGQPEPRRTTLVVQFVGEMDRSVSPIVISTSSEEAEWYKQQLFKEPIGVLVNVDIVPASVLHEITESPSLRRALEHAKPAEEEPKTTPTVKFLAGAGHDYVQVMLDAQTSMTILLDIDKHVGGYPALESEIREIENRIRPSRRK
jgi:hypothetical protein